MLLTVKPLDMKCIFDSALEVSIFLVNDAAGFLVAKYSGYITIHVVELLSTWSDFL